VATQLARENITARSIPGGQFGDGSISNHRLTRLGLLMLVFGAVIVFGVVGAGAAPLGEVTEFSLPTTSSPGADAVGADGNVWFADHGTTPSIGKINPGTGAITEYNLAANGANPGATPSAPPAIAAGPDGNIWFTDEGPIKAIGRITTGGAVAEFSSDLPAGSVPFGIAAGPDGNIWFTDRSTTAPAIGRITPSGVITEFRGGITAGSKPSSLTVGSDGNLWFNDEGTQPAIGQFCLTGPPSCPTIDAITEYSSGLNPGGLPFGIGAGPDGNIWFPDNGTTKAVGMINPATHAISEDGMPPQASSPSGFAVGPDGNIWFLDGTARAIAMINPTTHAISEYSSGLNPGSALHWIKLGPDGNLWFTNSPAAIGRFGVGVSNHTCSGSLQGCNLSEVNLDNIVLTGANLEGANLRNAQLENAFLVGVNLQGDNLQRAQFQSHAFLSYANLQGANLQSANLTGADLTGASLGGSNLQGATLAGANLTRASVQGSNLLRADLTDANLTAASLLGANLSGAVWSNTICPDGTNSDNDGGTCVGHGV
jgi:streptogramin lyase